jgi:probable phosphoglycerate mutase
VLRPAGVFPVYFARHGETIYNAQNRVQGWQDSPLTESGRKQAHEIGLILRDLVSTNDTCFVCSPMARACLTMEIVLGVLGLPTDHYTSDERLLEVDYGEWSGRYIPDIKANDRERWQARERDKWNVPAPGGESYAMVATRVTDWLSGLKEETVAVGHGAFGRILRGLYCGQSWQEIAAMDEPQGVVFRLKHGRIDRVNPPRVGSV